jgi:hypothetical protein
MDAAAQNTQIWTGLFLIDIEPISVHIGGTARGY